MACVPGQTIIVDGEFRTGSVVGTAAACEAIAGADFRNEITMSTRPPGCYRYSGPYTSFHGYYFNHDFTGTLSGYFSQFHSVTCVLAVANATNATGAAPAEREQGATAFQTLGTTLGLAAADWIVCALLAICYARVMRKHHARDPLPARRRIQQRRSSPAGIVLQSWGASSGSSSSNRRASGASRNSMAKEEEEIKDEDAVDVRLLLSTWSDARWPTATEDVVAGRALWLGAPL